MLLLQILFFGQKTLLIKLLPLLLLQTEKQLTLRVLLLLQMRKQLLQMRKQLLQILFLNKIKLD
ncbi:MAG: hypothetical protein IIW89_06480 [Alistipes sp.]|nr:hypothetical protein [Alistipes sp.]